jgi:hypothetical protein
MTTLPLTIIIIEKNGDLRTLNIKDYREEELYKKCGFKKADDFINHCEWNVKIDGQKYFVSMFGKINGKANMENKYEFPPPIDNKLFFGSCALICYIKDTNSTSSVVLGRNPTKITFTHLSLELWSKIYEKLFGGFEDLSTNAKDDDKEYDELKDIPKKMKTKKGGYLKDGFVVDSENSDNDNEDEDTDTDDDITSEEDNIDGDIDDDNIIEDELENIDSELSEEEYDYSDDENK